MKCPKCGTNTGDFSTYCTHCGAYIRKEPDENRFLEIDPETMAEAVRSGRVQVASRERSTCHILRGLISYHKRMTMGNYPEQDFYVEALEYALGCVEARMKEETK